MIFRYSVFVEENAFEFEYINILTRFDIACDSTFNNGYAECGTINV